jgi:16S rRNA (cytosine1402-N4)-methyltransferase
MSPEPAQPPQDTVISPHTPVLLYETVNALQQSTGGVFVDATTGGGGHSEALHRTLSASQQLVCVDRDEQALAIAKARLTNAPNTNQAGLHFIKMPFSGLFKVLHSVGIRQVDGGLMADLGMSNIQLKSDSRGFSFQTDAPLDMRMDSSQLITAADIVNGWDETELARILKDYADERLARPLAAAIVKDRQKRPFSSTAELAALARAVYESKRCPTYPTHPATRLFQSLRIAVNDELGELEALLASLPELLAPGAIAAFITFHSIEDRLVKQAFRLAASSCICPPRLPVCQCQHRATFEILGKPIEASAEEVKANPQARSAKLRVARRL